MSRASSHVASVRFGCRVLTVVLLTGGAWAGAACEAPRDATALKIAALQQFLMVAALTCHDVAAYNGFVVSHQGELQQSDKALLRYFLGRDAGTGDRDYNAYKTRLANASSLESLHDPQFCQAADAAFGATTGRTVAEVVAQQPLPVDAGDVGCAPDDSRLAASGSDAGLQRQASLASR